MHCSPLSCMHFGLEHHCADVEQVQQVFYSLCSDSFRPSNERVVSATWLDWVIHNNSGQTSFPSTLTWHFDICHTQSQTHSTHSYHAYHNFSACTHITGVPRCTQIPCGWAVMHITPTPVPSGSVHPCNQCCPLRGCSHLGFLKKDKQTYTVFLTGGIMHRVWKLTHIKYVKRLIKSSLIWFQVMIRFSRPDHPEDWEKRSMYLESQTIHSPSGSDGSTADWQ